MLGLLLRIAGVALAATAATAAVVAIAAVVNGTITAGTIREQAKIKCPSAIKAVIQGMGTGQVKNAKMKCHPELKNMLFAEGRRTVGVGLFDNNTKVAEMTLETNEDIAENLSVGQVIYI